MNTTQATTSGTARIPTREEVLANPSTHKLTTDILALAVDKDVVDVVFDVILAARVLAGEMDRALGSDSDSEVELVKVLR